MKINIKWDRGSDEQLEDLIYWALYKAFDTALIWICIISLYAVFKKVGLL